MFFYTESGSIYEIDFDKNKIRRVHGEKDPTFRQGKDGEWKYFQSCSSVSVGYALLIQWEGSKSTLTSKITKVLSQGELNNEVHIS